MAVKGQNLVPDGFLWNMADNETICIDPLFMCPEQ